ncbi:unnamed protein product, partial [Discosporangium mesarthrocarpum]
LQILAEGLHPWHYFIGPEWKWNNFDFTIVMLCFPWPGLSGGGSVAILRLARLMRVMKIVRKVPQLQMIVMGLIGGLSSIGYILLLLLLVFYLYGVAGIYLYKDNDPWHFGNLQRAMLTLFRCTTLEDWSEIMYSNI